MTHRKHTHGGGTAEILKGDESVRRKLEVVLKCDSIGSTDAVVSAIEKIKSPALGVEVIHSGVGAVSKSDLAMALTGSKLVVGFEVGVAPKLDQWAKEHGVEVRIYDVIYKLTEDLETIVKSLTVPEAEEKVTGKAQVIALFKSVPGGIILGCRVEEGTLAVGKNFRVIAPAGVVHSGRIESLHIETKAVNEAKPGQQVGLKISDFKEGKVGDLVECFEKPVQRKSASWRPTGSILHIFA